MRSRSSACWLYASRWSRRSRECAELRPRGESVERQRPACSDELPEEEVEVDERAAHERARRVDDAPRGSVLGRARGGSGDGIRAGSTGRWSTRIIVQCRSASRSQRGDDESRWSFSPHAAQQAQARRSETTGRGRRATCARGAITPSSRILCPHPDVATLAVPRLCAIGRQAHRARAPRVAGSSLGRPAVSRLGPAESPRGLSCAIETLARPPKRLLASAVLEELQLAGNRPAPELDEPPDAR